MSRFIREDISTITTKSLPNNHDILNFPFFDASPNISIVIY